MVITEEYTVEQLATDIDQLATILDDVKPGWEELIELHMLDMMDSDYCIMGQVFGSYGEGKEAVGIGMYNDGPYDHLLGAVLDGENFWIQQINKRLGIV